MRTNHKLLDLFSGIGGFSLGAEQNGIETIGFVEKDEFCQKVLKKHWSDVPIIDDIRKVNGKDFGAATIISGGFPCQPFSIAGKRKGKDDDRYLWDETIRVVAECKPKWFIGENVDGIVNISNGTILRQIQEDLEKEGFQVQCLVIPASGIGAWHQRKRVWIIGHNVSHTNHVSNTNTGFSNGENHEVQARRSSIDNGSKNVSNTKGKLSDGCSSTTRLSESKQEWMDSHSQEHKDKVWGETERCGEQVANRRNVSDSDSSRFKKQWQPKSDEKKNKTAECRSWWQTQSELCGVPNGISYELHSDRTNRIKALGNSIVPQIAEQIFRSIIDAE